MAESNGTGAAEDAEVETSSKNPEYDAQQRNLDHKVLQLNVANAEERVELHKQQLEDSKEQLKTAQAELAEFEKEDN